LKFNSPALLLPLTILAALMVVASLLYVRCFYGVVDLFKHFKIPPHVKPAIGAFATGLFALGVFRALAYFGPEAQTDSLNVLSFGYGILQKLLDGPFHHHLIGAVIVLGAIGMGKILTTSLTIGSAGPAACSGRAWSSAGPSAAPSA